MHPVGFPEFGFHSSAGPELQTSYISVDLPHLQSRLLKASIDQSIDLVELTHDLEMSLLPAYLDRSAA